MSKLMTNRFEAAPILLRASHVTLTASDERSRCLFARRPRRSARTILDDVCLDVRDGEIVALVGASGAGKSTLLRVLAGLASPTEGEVRYRGRALAGANPGVGFVFQSAALLPWLTVRQNVETGLAARGMGAATRAELAAREIERIGLAGREDAYPRELSGGQRQRVGIARALAVCPDLLFMDEPFSALDAPTAARLRREVTGLLDAESRIVRSVVVVTHGIEEAVEMADRVVVLGADPGHVAHELAIDLPRPRRADDPDFRRAVKELRELLVLA